MKSLKIRFKILGKVWILKLLPKKKFNDKYSARFLAVTEVDKRRIIAKLSGIDKETLVHELVHAYIGELCIHSMTLDHDNFEEFMAELVSKRGKEILVLGKHLSTKAQKLVS